MMEDCLPVVLKVTQGVSLLAQNHPTSTPKRSVAGRSELRDILAHVNIPARLKRNKPGHKVKMLS